MEHILHKGGFAYLPRTDQNDRLPEKKIFQKSIF